MIWKEIEGMDKIKNDFIIATQKYFDSCNVEQMEARKNEMMKIIEIVFKYENIYKMHSQKGE